MRRYQGTLLAAGIITALAAVFWFGRASLAPDISPISSPGTQAVSPAAAPAVSPDALVAPEPTPPVENNPRQSRSYSAAIAQEISTGRILYSFQADLRWPIASLTKLMTAAVVADSMDISSTIALDAADFAVGGSRLTANLQPGDAYRVEDLLKILLIPSSNEAAEAFARTYGRSSFMAAMNSKAALWGLSATHFGDPSGLSAANQSTPKEFVEMVRRIHADHPEIFSITRSSGMAVQELGTGAWKYFSATNNFAGRSEFLGGKTGTTPAAGGNLVSIFPIGGEPVVILVFGSGDRYAATADLLQWLQADSLP